jgi:hypothetical protein
VQFAVSLRAKIASSRLNCAAILPESSMKNTKERLTRLALEEIFGRENVHTIFEGSDSIEEDVSYLGATDCASLCEKVR